MRGAKVSFWLSHQNIVNFSICIPCIQPPMNPFYVIFCKQAPNFVRLLLSFVFVSFKMFGGLSSFVVVLFGSSLVLCLYSDLGMYMVRVYTVDWYLATHVDFLRLIVLQDEVFHIPQAQHYCHNEFGIWNKGITTFPGLYWTSYFLNLILNIFGLISCSTWTLRWLNVLLSSLLPMAANRCRNMVSFLKLYL